MNGVNKIISREFAPDVETVKPKENSGLGKMFGEMLLPPDGFGKRPGATPGSGSRARSTSGRQVVFRILTDRIRYMDTSMTVPIMLETIGKNRIISAGFDIQIDSETKRMPVSEWESSLGLSSPFSIADCSVAVNQIDEKKTRAEVIFGESDTETMLGEFRFIKQYTDKGTCHSIRITSDTAHGVKMLITVALKLCRKDIKPAFIFEREIANG